VNDGPEAAGAIDESTLPRVDAVIADSAALAGLSAPELRRLSDAVTRDGLGLLLTASTSTAPLYSAFALRATDSAATLDRRVAHPTWRGMPRRSQLGIDVAPAALRQRADLQPLVYDETGRWLAASQPAGEGRLAVSLVRTPSRWELEGENDAFASYWSLLLAAVARDTVTELRVEGAAPRVDHRVDVTLRTTTARPTLAAVAGDGTQLPIALARDPFDPRLWRGTFWPRHTGWMALQLGDRTVPVLVTPALPGNVRAQASGEPSPRTIGAFLLLLLALTVLWWESRRRIGA
jgi:hypothetical protein